MGRGFWWYFLRTIQIVWVLPATVLVWLFYILPMWIVFRDLVWMGWAEYGIAEFILAPKDLEPWHVKLWRDWGGWGGPCCFVRRASMSEASVNRTRKHEIKHCCQQFILGVFHYPAYLVESLYIWFVRKDLHAYLDNWFERDARRAAGQLIDIPRDQWRDGAGDRWPWW